MLNLDFDLYQKLVKKVGAMSKLYSDSATPFLSPRFIEKLFIITSSSLNYSRTDMSFDAKLPNGGGVGIKTFNANKNSKGSTEKVAEFNASEYTINFANKSKISLAKQVAEFRNARISSDSRIYDIQMKNSIYHCLIRVPHGCFIHEEPYDLIKINSIKLISNLNKSSHVHFTDSKNKYVFNTSKNTLYKYFNFSKGINSEIVDIKIYDQIFDSLIEGSIFKELNLEGGNMMAEDEINKRFESAQFIILPLYSTSTGLVASKSGINQWNAGGRNRKFGEGYIPVPSIIHKKLPNFFPGKDIIFKIATPDERKLDVKICQQGGKALMSNPNNLLCDWLFRMIDESELQSRKRQMTSKPYTYDDLLRIGKDSVKIYKILNDDDKYEFYLQPSPIGSYEDFISKI